MIAPSVADRRSGWLLLNAVVSLAVVAVAVDRAPKLLGGLLIAALIAASLEVIVPLRPGRRRRAWWTDLTYAVGNRTLILPSLGLLLLVLSAVSGHLPTGQLRAAIQGLPDAARFLVFFLLTDLANYATHRILHRVGFLWRLHSVHHSSERVDWLATARGHPLDQALNIAGASVPLYLVGGAHYAPALIGFLYLYPFVLHASARIRLGPLRFVLVTPEFHHWHHARDAAAHDRNFGAILSIWDHLFGTAVAATGHPDEYGIDDQALGERLYVGQIVSPLLPRKLSNRIPAGV